MYAKISLSIINHTIKQNETVVMPWTLPGVQIYHSLLKLCGNRKDKVSVQIQDQIKASKNKPEKQFTTTPQKKEKNRIPKNNRATLVQLDLKIPSNS